MKLDPKGTEYAERVTAAICAQIEAGASDADWHMPWHNVPAGYFTPTNAATGATYRGANALGLWVIATEQGWPNYWGTYNQWQEIGGQVHKGAESVARILRPLTKKTEDPDTGDTKVRTFGFKSHAVFNVAQQEGWTAPAVEVPEHQDDAAADIAAAERFVRRVGARLTTQMTGAAYYSPALDAITLPDASLWTSADAAWSTACHELTHWTGHESRLARSKFTDRFGSDGYAVEELTAELGSAMTLAAIGRCAEPRPDHAQYLANWLRVLRADATAILDVAGKSARAAEYITSRVDTTVGIAA
jgi:antirestriction protein ArdC